MSPLPPGDFDHVFIVQQTGQILVLDLGTGVLNPKPFSISTGD
jgi:hypothetical protein